MRAPSTTEQPQRRTKKAPAYFDVKWEVADVSALQRTFQGGADAETAKRAFELIINQICHTYDISFQPGQPDATAFAEGRRFVGAKIVEFLKVSTNALTKREQSN